MCFYRIVDWLCFRMPMVDYGAWKTKRIVSVFDAYLVRRAEAFAHVFMKTKS